MSTYELAARRADWEDFGDEIVLIETASGTFFSLKGKAMDAWLACSRGVDAPALDTAIAALPPAERSVLTSMVADLGAAGLIVRSECETAPGTFEWISTAAPAFEKNSDFEDLIKLDPIHDVSDAGWPHKPPTP